MRASSRRGGGLPACCITGGGQHPGGLALVPVPSSGRLRLGRAKPDRLATSTRMCPPCSGGCSIDPHAVSSSAGSARSWLAAPRAAMELGPLAVVFGCVWEADIGFYDSRAKPKKPQMSTSVGAGGLRNLVSGCCGRPDPETRAVKTICASLLVRSEYVCTKVAQLYCGDSVATNALARLRVAQLGCVWGICSEPWRSIQGSHAAPPMEKRMVARCVDRTTPKRTLDGCGSDAVTDILGDAAGTKACRSTHGTKRPGTEHGGTDRQRMRCRQNDSQTCLQCTAREAAATANRDRARRMDLIDRGTTQE